MYENEFSTLLDNLNHLQTYKCITVERSFLNTLEGGCSAPIGAFAKQENHSIHFHGAICSLDGSKRIDVTDKFEAHLYKDKEKVSENIAKANASLSPIPGPATRKQEGGECEMLSVSKLVAL